MRSVKITSPTLSLLVIAENAKSAPSSAARAPFVCWTLPKTVDAIASTSSMTVSSRSSAYHLIGVDLLRLGLVGDDDAMAEYVGTDRLDVLRRHVATSLQERVRLGSERQVEGRARRGAVFDERGELQTVCRRLARREHDVD